MEFTDFSTGNNDISRRIDRISKMILKDFSLSEVYKYLRKGLIKVNHKKVKNDYKIKENDKIQIANFLLSNKNNLNQLKNKKENSFDLNEFIKLIIFENEHILILNKPYGVLVHEKENCLDFLVKQYYKTKKTEDSLSFTPGPLHRLDKNTTGLIAFSMSLKGAIWFSQKIQNHLIQKKYIGIVCGKITKDELWEDFIIQKKENEFNKNQFHTVSIKNQNDKNNKNEKLAITYVSPIKSKKVNNIEVTKVIFSIKTGRKHQIRVQSAFHNHPLFGDSIYDIKNMSNGFTKKHFLHAKTLEFPQNNLGIPRKIECKSDWEDEF